MPTTIVNIPIINVVTCPTQVITTPTYFPAICQTGATTCASTTIYVDCTNATGTIPIWSTNSPTCGTWTSTNCVTAPCIIDVDEEDWAVNHEQYMQLARTRAVDFRIRTAEMRRQEEERRQEAIVRAAQAQHEREQATKKSYELLWSHLRPEQRQTFKEHKWFVVEGGRSKTQYRIKDKGSTTANIDVLNKNGDLSHRLCGHGAGYYPLYDHLLMQKIMLQYDEDRFLSIANRHAA